MSKLLLRHIEYLNNCSMSETTVSVSNDDLNPEDDVLEIDTDDINETIIEVTTSIDEVNDSVEDLTFMLNLGNILQEHGYQKSTAILLDHIGILNILKNKNSNIYGSESITIENLELQKELIVQGCESFIDDWIDNFIKFCKYLWEKIEKIYIWILEKFGFTKKKTDEVYQKTETTIKTSNIFDKNLFNEKMTNVASYNEFQSKIQLAKLNLTITFNTLYDISGSSLKPIANTEEQIEINNRAHKVWNPVHLKEAYKILNETFTEYNSSQLNKWKGLAKQSIQKTTELANRVKKNRGAGSSYKKSQKEIERYQRQLTSATTSFNKNIIELIQCANVFFKVCSIWIECSKSEMTNKELDRLQNKLKNNYSDLQS